jgi:hypothetical protein
MFKTTKISRQKSENQGQDPSLRIFFGLWFEVGITPMATTKNMKIKAPNQVNLNVTDSSTPHSLLPVDVRFQPFIDLEGVSKWKLRMNFSQECRAVQMSNGAGLLN